MSYLGPLRLHFAGRFCAGPSTVNNDPTHYDNDSFQASFQQRTDDSWNPCGDGTWCLRKCCVTAAFGADGKPVADDDAVRTCLITDEAGRPTAKLVDLDPMQQLASEIWGWEICVRSASNDPVFSGRFAPAALLDIWDRAGAGQGDPGAGAAYQSILTGLRWFDLSGSDMLRELKGLSADSLSIKFNVDGFHTEAGPDFMTGRIVGTIGPRKDGEPRHMVRGRRLLVRGQSSMDDIFLPEHGINFCTAVVDDLDAPDGASCVYLDLGNALTCDGDSGEMSNLGTLDLVCLDGSGDPPTLGSCAYLPPAGGWYEQTAGVVPLPIAPEQADAVATNPLGLRLTKDDGTPVIAASEASDGLHVRADDFVYRLNPSQRASVDLYATRFGKPLAGARVVVFLDDLQLQGTAGVPLAVAGASDIPAGVPATALHFSARVETNADGIAKLRLTGADPGNPRRYIDGQVFGIRPALEETLALGSEHEFDQWEFISVLVWDEFNGGDPPCWHGAIEDVFQQYANLYPFTKRYIDFASYASVSAPENRKLIRQALAREFRSGAYMPVTRDMSRSKREAILRWLDVSDNEMPCKGEVPADEDEQTVSSSGPGPAAAREGQGETAAREGQGETAARAGQGESAAPAAQGKTAAARRRFVWRTQMRRK
jgi:hypothetical protein